MSLNENYVKKIKVHGRACQHCDIQRASNRAGDSIIHVYIIQRASNRAGDSIIHVYIIQRASNRAEIR